MFPAAALCAAGLFSAPLRGGGRCSARWSALTGAEGAAENGPESRSDSAEDGLSFAPLFRL